VLLALCLFWILFIWAVKDGDMYAKEAACYVVAWVGLVAWGAVDSAHVVYCIAGHVFLDILLLMKVLGQNLEIPQG